MFVAHLELPKSLAWITIRTSPSKRWIKYSPVGQDNNDLDADYRMLEVCQEVVSLVCHRHREDGQENTDSNEGLTPLGEEEVTVDECFRSYNEDWMEKHHE